MGDRFMMNSKQFTSEQEDPENSLETKGDSLRSSSIKMASVSSSPRKGTRRAIQKRVVSVPIKDIEGSRLKGDQISTPPSDSWAWRKYGQKPIKGSPYPRGYYRCSSSKGCPARKQVERSRLDPNMLIVTYSCEHNHPWPASKNNHHHHNHHAAPTSAATATASTPTTTTTTNDSTSASEDQEDQKPETSAGKSEELNSDEKLAGLGDDPSSLMINVSDEFGWFSEFDQSTSCCAMLEESPILTDRRVINDGNGEMATLFKMRDEDESFFADLGELPECSAVFHHGMAEEQRRCSLARWCGTTG